MKRLERYLLIFLIALVAVEGFSFMYLRLWYLVGLPLKWWASMITATLGGLSTWGLSAWIERVTIDA